jgi:hypothetical protein
MTSPLNPTRLPLRLREENFRRFEAVLAAAITNPMQTIRFDPANMGLTTETAISRLRDAIQSALKPENNWVSAYFTREQFAAWRAESIVTRSDDGKVLLGPRIGYDSSLCAPLEAPKSTTVRVKDPTLHDVKCFLHLVNKGHLDGPYELDMGSIKRAIDMLEEINLAVAERGYHNIEVIRNGEIIVVL